VLAALICERGWRLRRRRVAPCSADLVDLGAQSDLIGVPEPTSIEAVLAAPNGGYVRASTMDSSHTK